DPVEVPESVVERVRGVRVCRQLAHEREHARCGLTTDRPLIDTGRHTREGGIRRHEPVEVNDVAHTSTQESKKEPSASTPAGGGDQSGASTVRSAAAGSTARARFRITPASRIPVADSAA